MTMGCQTRGKMDEEWFFGFVLRAMRGMTVGEETTDATV